MKGIAEIGGVEELNNLKELLYLGLDFAELITKLTTFYFVGDLLNSLFGASFK